MTIAEKILARAVGRSSVAPGDYLEVTPTTVTVTGVSNARSAPELRQMMESGQRLFDPKRVMVVDGHLGASASNGAGDP
jgi:homoaconitase/3-isopropylmalate dehydratase large subunit